MPKRILAIDDESIIRKLYLRALEPLSYEVVTAGSGEEGLLRLRSSTFDLVFLDLKMPGLSGIETLSEIRNLHPNIPVIVVTGMYREFLPEILNLQKQGVSFDILHKPLGLIEIVKAVQKALAI